MSKYYSVKNTIEHALVQFDNGENRDFGERFHSRWGGQAFAELEAIVYCRRHDCPAGVDSAMAALEQILLPMVPPDTPRPVRHVSRRTAQTPQRSL